MLLLPIQTIAQLTQHRGSSCSVIYAKKRVLDMLYLMDLVCDRFRLVNIDAWHSPASHVVRYWISEVQVPIDREDRLIELCREHKLYAQRPVNGLKRTGARSYARSCIPLISPLLPTQIDLCGV